MMTIDVIKESDLWNTRVNTPAVREEEDRIRTEFFDKKYAADPKWRKREKALLDLELQLQGHEVVNVYGNTEQLTKEEIRKKLTAMKADFNKQLGKALYE